MYRSVLTHTMTLVLACSTNQVGICACSGNSEMGSWCQARYFGHQPGVRWLP